MAEAVADTDIPSHFLSVGADGVIDRAGLGRATPATTLSRTGDAMDGVTYVSGSVENVTQSFVGLLPNTNLGAPLIEAPMDTTWRGRYYLLLNNATHPITFNVTFGAGDQAGTITTDPDIRGTYTTTFTLSFTAEGVITGNVLLDSLLPDDTAQARGLIGEQGLVGVFANTDGGIWGGSLHGGFVADAPVPAATDGKVDYRDWLAIGETVALPSTPVKNEFISGILAAGVPDEDGSVANHRSYGANTLNNAIHKDGTFGGDANESFIMVTMPQEMIFIMLGFWQGQMWAHR